MRKLARKVAHANMKKAGIHKPNSRPWVMNPESRMMERADSFFSQHWRKYAGI